MRYLVLWLGTLAGIALLGLIVAGLVWLGMQFWWIPVLFLLALLVATVITAIDWWTDHPRVPRGPEDVEV